MKLFFTVLMIINCCAMGNSIAMQHDSRKNLKDSLNMLSEKLNILENILISEKKTTKVIRDQSEIYKDIQTWIHEFDWFEFTLFGDFATFTGDLKQIEKKYPGQILNKIFNDLEKPLTQLLLSVQGINRSKLDKNNIEKIFLPNQFEKPTELKEVSLHFSTGFKLNAFLDMIRKINETLFKNGLDAREIKRFDEASENIKKTINEILEELKKLEADYKPVSSKCLIS